MAQSLTQFRASLPGELLALHTFRKDAADLLVDLGHGPLALRLQRADRRGQLRLADGLSLVPLGDAAGCEEVHRALAEDPTLGRRLLLAAEHGAPSEYASQMADPFANPGTLSVLIRATVAADKDAAGRAAESFVDAAGGRTWERRVAVGMLMLNNAHQEALEQGMRLLSVASGHERVLLGAQLAAALREVDEIEDADRMERETAGDEPPRDALPEPWNEQARRLAAASAQELALARGSQVGSDPSEDRLFAARRLARDGELAEAAWTLVRCWRQRGEPAWLATMGECLIALGQPRRGLAYVEDAQAAESGWVGLHAVASRGLAAIGHVEASRAQMTYAMERAPGVFEGLQRELPEADSELEPFAVEILAEGFLNRSSDLVSYRVSAQEVRLTPPLAAVRDVLLEVSRDAVVFRLAEES